jgi:hypothetical protein
MRLVEQVTAWLFRSLAPDHGFFRKSGRWPLEPVVRTEDGEEWQRRTRFLPRCRTRGRLRENVLPTSLRDALRRFRGTAQGNSPMNWRAAAQGTRG